MGIYGQVWWFIVNLSCHKDLCLLGWTWRKIAKNHSEGSGDVNCKLYLCPRSHLPFWDGRQHRSSPSGPNELSNL
jgi:hypothetical protein